MKTTATASAQATVNKHFEKEGGGENIDEFSSVPRNRKMIYNHAKVSESRTSDFRALMEMNLEDDFVQGFEIFKCPEKGPLPRCVLYTSQQIEDIKRYCCEGNSILSFDCTFDLGPAYVTVGCFRHPGFVNKSNRKHALMPGPFLLHAKRDLDTYAYFGHQISSALSGKTVNFIGTDNELALHKGLKSTRSFNSSQHLLCMLHSRRNVEAKLAEIGVTKNANRISRSIFGEQVGATRYEGIVDAQTDEQYEEQLTHWTGTWDALEEEETGKAPVFSTWYHRYKSAQVKGAMMRALREAAGLGNPPLQYTTNDCETINSMLSKWTSKQMTWDKLARSLQDFVKSKYKEVEMALLGLGDLQVSDDYQHLQKDQVQWRTMTQAERIQVMTEAGLQEHTAPPVSAPPVSLSIRPEESAIGGFTLPQLEDVWKKAEGILGTEGAIVQFPSAEDQWMCFSGNDHFKVVKRDTLECQKMCRSFQFHDRCFCEHTLATADKHGILAEHILKINKKKRSSSVNLMNSVLQTQCDVLRSGKKTSKRKGANNSTSTGVKKVVPMNVTHQPFTVTLKIGIISTCYGCKEKFSAGMNTPPNDLILKKLDFREWFDKQRGDIRKSSSLVPTYYHLRLDCLRRRYPYTQLNNILLYHEVEDELTDEHKNKLRTFGLEI